MVKSVFLSSYLDQQQTVNSLLQESHAKADFYVLLGLATFISTIGLLINNGVIIIGGMLIAPILFPILSLALGVVTSSKLALFRALKIIVKAIFTVWAVSFVTVFLFQSSDLSIGSEILLRTKPDILLFLVSFAAGMAVTYSWVKQDLSATLPGVAVSVTLLPPLSAFSIGLMFLNREIMAGALNVFFLDALATILGAIVIFSLFGFSNLQKEEEEKITEEKLEDEVQKQAIEEVINE